MSGIWHLRARIFINGGRSRRTDLRTCDGKRVTPRFPHTEDYVQLGVLLNLAKKWMSRHWDSVEERMTSETRILEKLETY